MSSIRGKTLEQHWNEFKGSLKVQESWKQKASTVENDITDFYSFLSTAEARASTQQYANTALP